MHYIERAGEKLSCTEQAATKFYKKNSPNITKQIGNVIILNEKDANTIFTQYRVGTHGRYAMFKALVHDASMHMMVQSVYKHAVQQQDKGRDHGQREVQADNLNKFEDFKGDYLKTKILLAFTQELNEASLRLNKDEFKDLVKHIIETDPKYAVLKTGQGWATQTFKFIKTDSVKAFKDIADKIEASLPDPPSHKKTH